MPPDPAAPATSTQAVISLVFGMLAWVGLPLLGALVAIVCGHLGRAEIRRSAGGLQGDGMALTGLILGWGQLALIVLVGVFWLLAVVLLGVGFGLFNP